MLPNLQGAIKSEGLASAVANHLDQTREHGPRLEKVFRAIDAEPTSNLSPPMEKLAQHHDELADNFEDRTLADVFHATAAATTEQLELAAYDTLLTLAPALELSPDACTCLEHNRQEDAEALQHLQNELERLVSGLRS